MKSVFFTSHTNAEQPAASPTPVRPPRPEVFSYQCFAVFLCKTPVGETEEMLYALAMSREGEEGREDRRNAKTKVICKPLLHRNSFPTPCFCVSVCTHSLRSSHRWFFRSLLDHLLLPEVVTLQRPPLSLPHC